MKATVLVVDDAEDVGILLATILTKGNYQVRVLKDGASLRQALNGPQPDVVLLDLNLPDADGLELLPPLKKQWPETEVIVLTGFATIDAAVTATKLGAYDFQKKPFDPKGLLLAVERALEHKSLKERTSSLRQALSAMSGGASPIFQSPQMKDMLRTIERIAPSDVSVLITGESGTGKEVVADLIHTMSPRIKGPFIKINCAALPRELIESELFGSVKGAFTGAQTDREGLFRQAECGTLLLDELSEMPIDTQSKLLRILQEKEVRPVGGRTTYKIDCRILAATNRAVDEAIRDGKLREDLYYRISAISIAVPPLRERRDDILPLATAFLRRFAAQANRVIAGFSPEAAECLRQFNWPGNVRQLQNEVQRAVLLCEGPQVERQDLSMAAPPNYAESESGSESESEAEPDDPNLSLMEAMERNAIVQVLRETKGNKLETAKRLGIGRQTLYNKIKTYGIEVPLARNEPASEA